MAGGQPLIDPSCPVVPFDTQAGGRARLATEGDIHGVLASIADADERAGRVQVGAPIVLGAIRGDLDGDRRSRITGGLVASGGHGGH
jgi:hypothetical protein